ncbi:zinc finger protein CONSTANS-LIKE 10-like [Camellia sinensis]|nr:zinc finger protein CONSTANS-LIKE 10-like [Camellia sinensis]
MGQLCDLCRDQRSMVYCQSDNACLCFSRDWNVHSTNVISRCHSRTHVCERCNSQLAIIRCIEEEISFCSNCYWIGHVSCTSTSGHERQTINCYSGCPSVEELSKIWSFVLESPSVDDPSREQGSGLLGVTDGNGDDRLLRQVHEECCLDGILFSGCYGSPASYC